MRHILSFEDDDTGWGMGVRDASGSLGYFLSQTWQSVGLWKKM